jgi:hypothetical protein
MGRTIKTAYNSTLPKVAVQWLNEAFWFASIFVVKLATYKKSKNVIRYLRIRPIILGFIKTLTKIKKYYSILFVIISIVSWGVAAHICPLFISIKNKIWFISNTNHYLKVR